jgi:hypothetical protein
MREPPPHGKNGVCDRGGVALLFEGTDFARTDIIGTLS